MAFSGAGNLRRDAASDHFFGGRTIWNTRVLFGFAVLDFAGAAIGVKLIDLFGNEKHRFLIA